MQRAVLKLVEECSGEGELTIGAASRRVRYRIRRYQGMLEESGMPVPGVHRIEGSVDFDGDASARVGADATLTLDDGRTVRVTVADATGRLLAEGHGPRGGCACC